MGVLHLVPYILLVFVISWLVWPFVADPLRRRLNQFHPKAPSPDGVADSLFVTWANRSNSH